jgi:hypothetical protein
VDTEQDHEASLIPQVLTMDPKIRKKWQETTRYLFDVMYSGWTDEDLLLRPRELQHFTRVVSRALEQELNSYDVTRLLMAKRKKGSSPFGKKRKKFVRILDLELQAAGTNMTVDDFKGKIIEVFLRDNPPDGVEQLIRRWELAVEFCDSVRKDIGFVGNVQITDVMILRTLVRLRKSGWVRPEERVDDEQSGDPKDKEN